MRAPDAKSQPLPRRFLERVSRVLLARALAAHDAELRAHGFALDALAGSAQTDRSHVDALWRLLGAPPPSLTKLKDELLAIADVATRGGHEQLLAFDTARALDHELGDEDCAATAFLDHRSLFDRARPHAGGAGSKAFASFEAESPEPLLPDEAKDAAFARAMGDALEQRGRTRYFKAHHWTAATAATEHHFDLVFGRLASARDLLGKVSAATHDITAQVTDRTTERAHAVFHHDTKRLDVAGPEWVKELVRRAVGEAYFGDAAHFHGSEVISLAPLQGSLAAALRHDDVAGVTKVVLQQVWIDLADGSGWIAAGARTDCATGAAGEYAVRGLSDGTAVEATFLLYVTGKSRPVTLKIVAPAKMEYVRTDPRIVRIVRAWVVARGYTRSSPHAEDLGASSAGEASADDAGGVGEAAG